MQYQVIQYIPINMHTVFALLCFVVVIHWHIFPYPSGLLHWHCGNLTIAPVPAKQPWWIWISTSCEISMNDYITTTKQSTTKPCAYFLGYTVLDRFSKVVATFNHMGWSLKFLWPPMGISELSHLFEFNVMHCMLSTFHVLSWIVANINESSLSQ